MGKNKFLFIAATHGDEGFSVDVLRKLEKKYSRKTYNYDWIIGNEKAFKANKRFIDADLNRVAPGNIKSTIYEERRAAEIIKLSSNYSYVIDLHGAVSNCGIISIITKPTLANLFLASVVRIKRNVVWYSSNSLVKGPLSQFTLCPSIEIECGLQGSGSVKKELTKILKNIISARGKGDFKEMLSGLADKEFYSVYGKKQGKHDFKVKDFNLVRDKDESFYPFLSNQYEGTHCYKMKKIDFCDLLSYNSR